MRLINVLPKMHEKQHKIVQKEKQPPPDYYYLYLSIFFSPIKFSRRSNVWMKSAILPEVIINRFWIISHVYAKYFWIYIFICELIFKIFVAHFRTSEY